MPTLHPPQWRGDARRQPDGPRGALQEIFDVGRAADLVVVAQDFSRVPIERLHKVGVLMTLVGGEMVYEGYGTPCQRRVSAPAVPPLAASRSGRQLMSFLAL